VSGIRKWLLKRLIGKRWVLANATLGRGSVVTGDGLAINAYFPAEVDQAWSYEWFTPTRPARQALTIYPPKEPQ